MSRTRTVIPALLLAVLGALLPGLPAAAQPAVLVAFDLETVAGSPPADGSARATGSVTFPARGSVRVTGSINDRCPADGYGAYLYMSGAYANGDSIWATPRLVASDTRTCDAAGVVNFDRGFTPDPNRTIAWVSLNVYEIDRDTGAYGNVSPARRIYR